MDESHVMKVHRKVSEGRRDNIKWDDKWRDLPQSLVTSWERGLEKAGEDPDLAARIRDGELPILPWKGGVEKTLKKKQKYGTLYYLAMWQGLRGIDLDIDTTKEISITCTATGMIVVFTANPALYGEP